MVQDMSVQGYGYTAEHSKNILTGRQEANVPSWATQRPMSGTAEMNSSNRIEFGCLQWLDVIFLGRFFVLANGDCIYWSILESLGPTYF